MNRSVGIDFGTTNSALALAGSNGSSLLATFRTEEGEESSTFRSILYFSAEERGPDKRPGSTAGPDAIKKYLDADGKGRLIQSMKSHLASRTFDQTTILGRSSLDDLISIIMRKLREAAEKSFGDLGRRVVVGRPVHSQGQRMIMTTISPLAASDLPLKKQGSSRSHLNTNRWLPHISMSKSWTTMNWC
jgi:hypothetical chaperone protein